MTRTKATKTPKTKAPTRGETRTLEAQFVMNFDPVVMLAPPTELERCPRCEQPHKKLKPKKFMRPMLFPSSSASYWVLCPAAKEPVIFFDRFTKPIEKNVEKTISDKADVLNSLSTWTYTTAGKKGKKSKAKPMQITASFGPATTWVYDSTRRGARCPV